MVAIIIMILISKLTIIDIVDRKRYFIVWMFCDDYVTNVRKLVLFTNHAEYIMKFIS